MIYLFQHWINLGLAIIVFSILYLINWILFPVEELINLTYVSGKFSVIKLHSQGFFIKLKGQFIGLNCFFPVQINDIVDLKGKLIKSTNLASNLNSNFWIQVEQITLINKTQDLRNIITHFFSSNPWTSLILLGQKTLITKDLYQQSFKLNLSHFFVISGFHFNVIFKVFKKFFNFLKLNQTISNILSLSLLCFYLYLLNYSISALRAVLMLNFSLFFRIIQSFKHSFKFNKLDYWAFSLIVCSILNPPSIFEINFILSFLVSFILIFLTHFFYFSKPKSLIKKLVYKFIILFFLHMLLIPIQGLLNQQINVLAPLYNFWLTPLIFIFQILGLLLFPWPNLTNYCAILLTTIFNFFIQISWIYTTTIFKANICLMTYFVFFIALNQIYIFK